MQFNQEDVQRIIQSVTDAVIHAIEGVNVPVMPIPSNNDKPKYKANEAGFVRCPEVDAWLATLEAKDKAWLPQWFNWPAIHLNQVEYPTKEARLTARQNLSNRNFIIFGQRMLECKPLRWVTIPKTGVDIPWDEPNRYTYVYGDGFVPNSWSFGWDDKDIDGPAILAKVQAFYRNGAPGSGG